MRTLTCITCPMGCSLSAEEGPGGELTITGNRCKRGAEYAKEELRAPKRTVTATCGINGDNSPVRRAPVKTAAPCPKEKIQDLLRDIYSAKIDLPVSRGDIIIADWMGLGINVIATRSLPGCAPE